MNQEQARAFIVNELGKHRDRNDVIMTLCHELNLDWKQVEQFIKEVEGSQSQAIARRQSPLVIILGVAALIGGLGLLVNAVSFFWSFTQMAPEQQLLNGDLVYIYGGSMVTGIAMIVGGIIGLRKIIAGIL
jgi:hypothetical protein